MPRLSPDETAALVRGVDASMARADRLFGDLAAQTADEEGVTRASYGDGEQTAHRLFAEAAGQIGLEMKTDLAGNSYATLPGRDRDAPVLITGSHLDSVPRGGNYDGAAGVVAGLAALEAIQAAGLTPPQDIAVMAVRSEECSAWFKGRHDGHLGSRAALGLLRPDELDAAIHLETDATLAAQMAHCGLDPQRLADSPPHLTRDNVKAYTELHIEQGPVLESDAVPVGIVTGIRGNLRVRDAACLGEYTHSGAVPQSHRRDAVLATSELLLDLEREAQEILEAGGDMVFAAGKMHTDPAMHSLSKVPGEVRFTLDIRSLDEATLKRMHEVVEARAAAIAARRGVRFDFGGFSHSQPTVMTADHRDWMHQGAAALGIDAVDIISGGGHDAQEFERCGIPASMIFVRNANGSHNAAEAMDMDDFALGTRLLTWVLAGAL
ncbi:MAG: hydantoinase/carbamoylase family amidase [Alphaproteobacteria bacterium]|nr:hydantoinase/carbamoylase family amidase [Alphaproteobacteria bacterium]